GFGASVYPAAYVLAEYLERHPEIIKGKKVIELGAGTGFLGIAAAVLGASEVCITDGDKGLLRLITENVRANLPASLEEGAGRGGEDKCAEEAESNETSRADGETATAGRAAEGTAPAAVVKGKVEHQGKTSSDQGGGQEAAAAVVSVQRLLWGSQGDLEGVGGPRYDVVIGSDIVALPYGDAYHSLIETLTALLTPAAPMISRGGGSRGGGSSGAGKGGDMPLAVLAYKCRHVSEGSFFRAASGVFEGCRKHEVIRGGTDAGDNGKGC
ncbi:unnamed protein product, partial [Discosporangium mesarthrocarpum]